MSRQITINNKTYTVRPFVGELALIAINLQENLFQSFKKHNEFVNGLIQQLDDFNPSEIATLQGDEWVLKITLEQWFRILTELQKIAYSDMVQNAKDSEYPQDTLLAEKRAVENYAFVTVQQGKFEEYVTNFDDDWVEKLTKNKLTQTADYFRLLYEHWSGRVKHLEGSCKKFAQSQIAAIPKAYQKIPTTED